MSGKITPESIRLALQGSALVGGNARALDYAVRIISDVFAGRDSVGERFHERACVLTLDRLLADKTLRPATLQTQLASTTERLYKLMIQPAQEQMVEEKNDVRKVQVRKNREKLWQEARKRRNPVPDEDEGLSEFVKIRLYGERLPDEDKPKQRDR